MTVKYGYAIKINKPAVAGEPFLMDAVYRTHETAEFHASKYHKDILPTVVPVKLVEVKKLPSDKSLVQRLKMMLSVF